MSTCKKPMYDAWDAEMILATMTGGECLTFPGFDELAGWPPVTVWMESALIPSGTDSERLGRAPTGNPTDGPGQLNVKVAYTGQFETTARVICSGLPNRGSCRKRFVNKPCSLSDKA